MDDKRKPDPSTPGSDRRTPETERESSGNKIPPDDQHTPGEEGEHSGGGLRGA